MLHTIVRPCGADVAAIEDETAVDVFPIFFGNESFQVFRYLFEISVTGEVEPLREALHVGVGRNTFPHIEQFAQNDVRGLIPDAVERLQFMSGARHAAAVFFDDILGGRNDGLGLIAEKSDRRYLTFEYRGFRLCEVEGRLVFLEKRLCHPIDDFIRTLRGEHDRNNELERCLVCEFALWAGICALEVRDYSARPHFSFPHSAYCTIIGIETASSFSGRPDGLSLRSTRVAGPE